MKQKKFDEKLNLNKTTISNLQDGEMKEVNAGERCATQPITSCGTTNHYLCTKDPTIWPGYPCCY
jgi:hypothetical protein